MTEPTTPGLQPSPEHARERSLRERIERLKKLHDLRAPKRILCVEAMLVFKAAFVAHPVEMGEEFSRWASCSASGEVAICSRCGGYMPHEMHACDGCLQEQEDADD